MSYAQFLVKMVKKDSVSAYMEFLEKYDLLYSVVPAKMQKQYVDKNYVNRFIHSAWM